MNKDVWYRIFDNWCRCYWGIQVLEKSGIIDDEEAVKLRAKMLEDIIGTVQGEIEDE